LKKDLILKIVKWAWLALVFGGVVYYVVRNFAAIPKYLGLLSPMYIAIAVVFLVIGKLALVEVTRFSLRGQSWYPSYKQMLHINSQMQLAKYLPGGVWHFVGRFGLYCANGLPAVQASKSMLIENIWLVTSSTLFGVLVIGLGQPHMEVGLVHLPDTLPTRLGLLAVILLLWGLLQYLVGRVVFRRANLNLPDLVRLIAVQAGTWFFFGLGFLFAIPNFMNIQGLGGAAVGGFALAWIAGYITIFAPSGLGVREAVLTAMLAGFISPNGALIYAMVNRVVWVIVEVGLGIFCELRYGSGKDGLFISMQPSGKNLPE
jgi:hypothetical protein